MPRRVLICGSRHWRDVATIRVMVDSLEPGDVVIHGAAPGADRIGGNCAKQRRLDVEPYPADWRRYPKAAGAIRNRRMLAEGKPTEVWAFKENFDHTLSRGGTEDMVSIALDADVPVTIVEHPLEVSG